MTLAQFDVVAVNGSGNYEPAHAASAPRFVGISRDAYVNGVEPSLDRIEGTLAKVKFLPALALNEGEVAYLSTTAGKATNVKPTTGNVIAIGIVEDISDYAGFERAIVRLRYWDETSAVAIGIVQLWGNMLIVDDVNGSDATGTRGDAGKPYKTVQAAIAAALSGDQVFVRPGTYNLTAGITVPSNVSLRGAATGAVTIQMLAVTADTTLITMSNNSRVEDVALKLTSAQHHTLVGVKFGGTTSLDARLRTSTVTVDNSGAGAGASDVTGILVQTTGAPNRGQTAIRAATITVTSIGTGNKRGILMDTSAGSIFLRDVNFRVTGGTGSRIAVETNFAGCTLGFDYGNIDGESADISQTLGTLNLASVNLINSTGGGKAFTADAISFGMVWADDLGLPSNATRYYRPGTDPVSATEIKIQLPRKAVVKRLHVRAITAPGAAKTDTFTVRKNGVATTLTTTLSGAAQVSAEDSTHSVDFSAGDDISVQVVTAIATGTSDTVVTVEIY